MNVLTQSWAQSRNPKVRSFYQSLVFRLLKSLNRGSLRLRDTDGSERVFGQGNGGVQAQIRVLRPDFYRKCVLFGDIGFGESFVDGDWETDNLTDVVRWFIENAEDCSAVSGSKRTNFFFNVLSFANTILHRLKPNNLSGSTKNIRAHYDLSNDFFKTFLDPSLTYSCAYFKYKEQSLAAAQTEKYDLLCRKLRLKPTDHILEIGSGWGGFSLHAAKIYGSRVTTLTISQEQLKAARERIREAGLERQVDIQFLDYRQVRGSFDKIVSIEMLEAVGDPYFETYFAKCNELLKPQGLAGFQIITCADSRYEKLKNGVDWIQKHIFPGSLLPSIARINQAVGRTSNLQLYDLEDLGHFYAQTLTRWRETFTRNLDQVRGLGFDESFIRKWNYYLSYCEAAFATRHISVVQAVYTRPNNPILCG